ncbi:MAG: FAD-binding oxidoreductase, partial [Halioglobus sp.]|nr:FAD-binding oxidoreductase [Halioglobus sp.]
MTSRTPDYERRCGWNALLPEPPATEHLSGDKECDVIIVGAGYTGVAAARRYAELTPGASISILDATRIGEGNPGRNSGFLLEISLANDADAANMQRMQRCNELLGDTMRQLLEHAASAGPELQLTRAGTYRAAGGSAGVRALDRYREFLDAAELPVDVLTRDELSERIGTRFYQQGLYSPHCYLAQPAALIRSLAAGLPNTVSIYENSPALSMESVRDVWRVITPKGRITAPRLILANNAFCKGLGIGASRITAMYTYAALTSPLADGERQQCGSDPQWGVLPAHRLGSTLRKTADGRLLIRSLYGYEREADNETIATKLRAALLRRYPGLDAVPFESVWSGATGFTYNGAPLWGQIRTGLFVSAGCNGGGVVKGTLFGKLLAEHAHKLEVPDMAALFGQASWMPPEPLRALGFRIIAG